ncbi:hypothetical protein [Pedobacter helvus]|uniref:Uncharacterized protein n=1 Tax=Pedobacter helvus TaxID=2563444 RepID=A0ABW9JFX4_9SPHI|nr:hypothetical protein [Pedobacter ureilyticus]
MIITSFKKHPFENAKLIKEMNAIEEQWLSKKKSYKNHTRAIKGALPHQRELNKTIESLYHIAVPKIRSLFSKLSKFNRIAVEMNLKEHPLNVSELYSISFSTFFFDLCCDVRNKYHIVYKFHNCPIEADIRALTHRLSLTYYCKEDTRISDYKSYFERVLQVQPERFITLL